MKQNQPSKIDAFITEALKQLFEDAADITERIEQIEVTVPLLSERAVQRFSEFFADQAAQMQGEQNRYLEEVRDANDEVKRLRNEIASLKAGFLKLADSALEQYRDEIRMGAEARWRKRAMSFTVMALMSSIFAAFVVGVVASKEIPNLAASSQVQRVYSSLR